MGETRRRRVTLPRAEARRLGSAVARPGRIDGGELGAERVDEVPLGAAVPATR
jgi:hypothetical protein